MVSRSIRWGILATGGIARTVTAAVIAEGLNVSAVGSRTREQAQKFADHFSIDRAHCSYEELVNDPHIDAVYIATPHPMHRDNALLALNAGKHVLVEKAFTVNLAEAQEIMDAGRQNGLFVMEAMWTRFLPHMQRIREVVRSGVLGPIRSITANHCQRLTEAPEHRINDLRLGGGALLDLAVYPLSFTHDLFGVPQSISAEARFKDTGADAQVVTTMTYPDGLIATSTSASDASGPNGATIIGTEGFIVVDEVWYAPSGFTVYNSAREVIERYSPAEMGPDHVIASGHGRQFIEASRLIEQGKTESAVMTHQGTLDVMRTMDTIRAQIGLTYPGE